MEEKYKEFAQHFKQFEQNSSLMFDANYDINKILKEKIEIDKKLQHLFKSPKNDANDEKIAAVFKRIDEISKIIYSAEFSWGFTLKDFSNMDLSKVPIEKLLRTPFSTATKWPPKSKLPKGFDPEKLIEQAKTFKGCGVEKLHEQGITGKGVKVAYIDKNLDLSHIEFEGRKIEKVMLQTNPDVNFHGYAVLARLMGKNIGIAPDVDCVYYACDGINVKDLKPNECANEYETLKDLIDNIKVQVGSSFKNELDALNDILNRVQAGSSLQKEYSQLNKIIPQIILGAKLQNELDAFKDILKRVKSGEQIAAVGVSASIVNHIQQFAKGNKEKEEALLAKYNKYVQELHNCGTKVFTSDNFWQGFAYSFKVDPTKDNDDLNNYAYSNPQPNAVSVIDADKLIPLPYTTDGYKYENNLGSASWSIPQVLGLFCLAKQVDANLTMDEFAEIAQKTASKPNQYGARLINAVELIKEVKYRLENKCEV